ncbi:30S ribosomal protein S19 [Candidatus Bathyarchaeota archaeon RBG_13_38_9]|nr:small subunit ribosomal protein S19 [uncultured archaeon]OGD54792.1 MAG: 30S ribosomal protein S19 [Candidatus Bathyarchaeota archaeon RBG_13_38_9]
MPREFIYRGFNIQQLQEMSMDEFIKLLPSRQRRTLQRGLTSAQRRLLEEVKDFKRGTRKEGDVLKTHCRDMIVLPEMVGLRILVHNGKEFSAVDIKAEMVGHFFGEFAITNKKVGHGTPGIGASRSSMYVPLK